MVLVPTRELSEQVTAQLGALIPLLERDVSVVNVARDASHHVHKVLLAERPDIVVATPSRALAHVQAGTLDLTNLETLAIDEADLILSYGHDEALRSLPLPKGLQCLCMSATMTKDVTALKGLVLHNKPVSTIIRNSFVTYFCFDAAAELTRLCSRLSWISRIRSCQT